MTIDLTKFSLRPAHMAKRDGSKQWFVVPGCFFVEAYWDQDIEKWVPGDEATKSAIRTGACLFEPEFVLARIENREFTVYSNGAWLTDEELEDAA